MQLVARRLSLDNFLPPLQARTLALKMVKMYKLCSEQLSQQDHYDYGMRQVKSVLVMAGSQRRASPDAHESVALIRAMSEANEPRFLPRDLPLFHAIVKDLYPGVKVMGFDYSALTSAAEGQLSSQGLQPEEGFVQKVVQLYQVPSHESTQHPPHRTNPNPPAQRKFATPLALMSCRHAS